MSGSKYFVTIIRGKEVMIIFPDTQSHKEMALWTRFFGNIVSAGFVWQSDSGSYCHGKSDSLGIGSRPEDDKLLAAMGFKLTK